MFKLERMRKRTLHAIPDRVEFQLDLLRMSETEAKVLYNRQLSKFERMAIQKYGKDAVITVSNIGSFQGDFNQTVRLEMRPKS